MREVNYELEINRSKALKALEQMKALEATRKGHMTTVIINQHKISAANQHNIERLTRHINKNW